MELFDSQDTKEFFSSNYYEHNVNKVEFDCLNVSSGNVELKRFIRRRIVISATNLYVDTYDTLSCIVDCES